MNDRPVYEKDNALTRAIHDGNRRNLEKGAPISRGLRPMQAVGPRVTTGAMVAPDGIIPPVIQSPDGIPIPVPPSEQQHTGEQLPGPMRTGLPDFTRIQSIDLVNGKIIVDDTAFDLPAEDIREIKIYVIEAVTTAITKHVAFALAQLQMEAMRERERQAQESARAGGSVPTVTEGPGNATTDRGSEAPRVGAGNTAQSTETGSTEVVTDPNESAVSMPDMRNPGMVAGVPPVLHARRGRRKPKAIA